MAVSARNQLVGKVSATAHGAVNDEVELTLAGGARSLSLSSHPAVRKRWV
jgi:molybdate transport system regulatory protein